MTKDFIVTSYLLSMFIIYYLYICIRIRDNFILQNLVNRYLIIQVSLTTMHEITAIKLI